MYRFGVKGEEQGYSEHLEGYSISKYYGSHWSCAYHGSELNFLVCNGNEIVNSVSEENAKSQMYLVGYKYDRLFTVEHLCKLMKGDDFFVLYSDREYIKNNMEDMYTAQYIWNDRLTYVDRQLPKRSFQEVKNNIFEGSPILAEAFFDLRGDNKCRAFWKALESEARGMEALPYSTDQQREYERNHNFESEDRFMKMGLIIWHNQKIVAILIPYAVANIIRISGPMVSLKIDGKAMNARKVEAVVIEQGPNWEYYVATTIDYIARSLLLDLSKPIDVTEQKPEELTDELWSLWVRLRHGMKLV